MERAHNHHHHQTNVSGNTDKIWRTQLASLDDTTVCTVYVVCQCGCMQFWWKSSFCAVWHATQVSSLLYPVPLISVCNEFAHRTGRCVLPQTEYQNQFNKPPNALWMVALHITKCLPHLGTVDQLCCQFGWLPKLPPPSTGCIQLISIWIDRVRAKQQQQAAVIHLFYLWNVSLNQQTVHKDMGKQLTSATSSWRTDCFQSAAKIIQFYGTELFTYVNGNKLTKWVLCCNKSIENKSKQNKKT